ncbi:MAG: hypothetical protein ACI3VA_13525 [Candidatus Limivicinus sp.]
MSSNVFSLTLTNLALDGSLDLFVDLYKFTYNIYLNKLHETPWFIDNKSNWNWSTIPEILPEFELLAFRRLGIFTTKIKNIHLYPDHFKSFDFFDEKKVHDFEIMKQLNDERIRGGKKPFDERYLKSDKEEFEFQETVIDLQQFVNHFKLIVIQAIQEEVHKQDPSYTVFDARRDVDSRIAERMQMRRNECVVPSNLNYPPTDATLFVFESLNKTKCKINRHHVVSKKYYARDIEGKRTVALPVHYCETCSRYMIGSLSLSLVREHCGKFIARTTRLTSDGNSNWGFLGETTLHQLGYNVVDGNLTASERQSLLICLVESNQLSLFEVIATIEQNIRMFANNHRMQNAIIKWRSDLQFLNEYIIKQNEKAASHRM